MSRLDPDANRYRRGEPSAFAWCLAAISLALPWIAVALAGYGLFEVFIASELSGWGWVAAGGAVVVVDVVIDVMWARPDVLKSDQPDLNRRGAQYIGRIATVAEAVVNGRGRVKVGDSLWQAVGPDLPVGARARIVGVDVTVLVVEAVSARDPGQLKT